MDGNCYGDMKVSWQWIKSHCESMGRIEDHMHASCRCPIGGEWDIKRQEVRKVVGG